MDIIWVVKTTQEASYLNKNTPDNVTVIPALGMAGGRRANIVLVDEIWWHSDTERKAYEKWIKESVVCRLVPGGRMFMGVRIQDVMNYES